MKYFINVIFSIIYIFKLNALDDFYNKFNINESKNLKIYYEKNVEYKNVIDIQKEFDLIYNIIGSDLDFPRKKLTFFLYGSVENMRHDLIFRWNYSSYIIDYLQGLPAMNDEYELCVHEKSTAQYIAHEYTHRIIRQMIGENYKELFCWFDEGLAEYEGLIIQSRLLNNNEEYALEQYLKDFLLYYDQNKGNIFNIEGIKYDSEWMDISRLSNTLVYKQAALMTYYLIKEKGIKCVNSFLKELNKKNDFKKAFKKIFKFKQEDFINKFLNNIKLEKIKYEKYLKTYNENLLFDFNGENNGTINEDWQVDDGIDNLDIPEADIRNIYTVINNEKFYLLFTTEGEEINKKVWTCFYFIEIDVNNDGKKDFVINFSKMRSYLYNNRNWKEINALTYFGKTIKFMVPIEIINNHKDIKVRIYSGNGEDIYNSPKKWVSVQTK